MLGNLKHRLQIGIGRTANPIYAGNCSADLFAAMLVLCF